MNYRRSRENKEIFINRLRRERNKYPEIMEEEGISFIFLFNNYICEVSVLMNTDCTFTVHEAKVTKKIQKWYYFSVNLYTFHLQVWRKEIIQIRRNKLRMRNTDVGNLILKINQNFATYGALQSVQYIMTKYPNSSFTYHHILRMCLHENEGYYILDSVLL